MVSLFASGRKAHATILHVTGYSLLNPSHFHLKLYFEKSQSLALFLSSLPPYQHKEEEHDIEPSLSFK